MNEEEFDHITKNTNYRSKLLKVNHLDKNSYKLIENDSIAQLEQQERETSKFTSKLINYTVIPILEVSHAA